MRLVLRPILPCLLVLGLWLACAALGVLPRFAVATPSACLAEFSRIPEYFLEATLTTMLAVLCSVAAAVALGVPLGVLIGRYPLIHDLAMPLLLTTKAIPAVGYVPLLLIVLGMGMATKVTLGVLLAMVPLTLAIAFAVKHAPRELFLAVAALRPSRLRAVRHFVAPYCAVHLVLGLRLAIPLALIGVTVAEMTGADDRGLGNAITVAYGQFNLPAMYVALILLSLLAITLQFIVDLCALGVGHSDLDNDV